MYTYTPKLQHAIFTILFCMACLFLGSKARGQVLFAWNSGAVLFFFLTCVVVWLLILKAYDEHWETIASFAEVYNKLDEEGRAALGFMFPRMSYQMKRGEVRAFFENTNATIEHFREFLQTSNDRYISPRRDWTTADKPSWAWDEIKGWLEDHERIIPDSAAGSHSWLWSGNSYQYLMAYWMSGRKLVDMNERVYAYETTTPPPLEDVGGG